MKLSVIIPVYNEIFSIKELLLRVEKVKIDKEIIIVDDFSTDGTRQYLESLKPKDNFRILYHEYNQGKGACIRTALKFVRGDFVIIQDADLEYQPEEYKKLLEVAEENKALVVYGSRFLGGKINNFTPLQYLANRVLTFFTNFLYRTNLTDVETCYKLFQSDLIQSLEIKSKGFDIEVELTSEVLKRNIKILDVPIAYQGRKYHEGKKIKAKDGILSLIKLFIYRLI